MGRRVLRDDDLNEQQRHELHARAVRARRRAEQREQARVARGVRERLERQPPGPVDDRGVLPRVD